MTIGIYKITNNSNNKIYIGQSVDVEDRIKKHKRALRGNYHYNKHLQNSFNKYGEDSFEFKLLKACKEPYLDRFEKIHIHLNKSMNPKYGYNKDSGGSVQKKVSEETRKKLSEAKIGENNPMYGKPISEETRKKLSAVKRGKNNSQSKYILWDNEKCAYNKRDMFEKNEDGLDPRRCFRTKYNCKDLPIGNNLDFVTCEIIHDLINDAIK